MNEHSTLVRINPLEGLLPAHVVIPPSGALTKISLFIGQCTHHRR